MTGFEWNNTPDERYADMRSEEVPLSDNLYGFDCPNCGEEVWSEGAYMDPDGPSWDFNCHDCELRFRMQPTKVEIDAYEEE